jgi:ribosome-associated protein
MIPVTNTISLDEEELQFAFRRASGPGGQNVNKVETAVQLRFDVRRSPSLPEDIRARAERLAGRRLTQDGVLVLTAQRHRSQARNREDVVARLVALIQAAVVPPTPRRPTRPTTASRAHRLEAKGRRAAVKAIRSRRPVED